MVLCRCVRFDGDGGDGGALSSKGSERRRLRVREEGRAEATGEGSCGGER